MIRNQVKRFAFVIIVAVLISSLIGAAASPATAAETKRILVVPYYFNSPSEIDVSMKTLTKTFFAPSGSDSAAYGISTMTKGQFKITGNVSRPVQIPGDSTTCEYNSWKEDLQKVIPTGYDYYYFYSPLSYGPCTFSGITLADGKNVFFNYNGPTVIAHEFGHLIGLGHASSLICSPHGT